MAVISDITKHEQDALEALIDRRSIGAVLMALAHICAEKGDHTRHNWQDDALARRWEKLWRALALRSIKHTGFEGSRASFVVDLQAGPFSPAGQLRRDHHMPKSELFDLAAEKRGETPLAFRLYDGKVTEWVPKSQVEDNGDGTFTMPLWLAMDKGFV